MAGVATVAATTIGGFSLAHYPQLGPLRDVNIGVLALVVNLVVTALVAKLPQPSGRVSHLASR